jgi:L-cystine transport system permease protein
MTLFDFGYFLRGLPEIALHLPVTLGIAVLSFCISLIIGSATALVKIYHVRFLKNLAELYISFIRGTPLLVQLYLISYGIPKTVHFLQVEYGLLVGVNSTMINPLYFAVTAFSVYMGPYTAEAIRSAIEAVGVGQFEAAKSTGMTTPQALVRIVIPQSLGTALPILGNILIGAVKGTSFLFVLGIRDVMGQARIMGFKSFSYMEVYIAAALIYWAVCFLLERLFGYLEKKARHYEKPLTQEGGGP